MTEHDSHLHLWTKTSDGVEFGNAIYDNDTDGAQAFLGVVKSVCKYTFENHEITIEDVLLSLEEGNGMYAGVPGFIIVLSRCEYCACMSATWN